MQDPIRPKRRFLEALDYIDDDNSNDDKEKCEHSQRQCTTIPIPTQLPRSQPQTKSKQIFFNFYSEESKKCILVIEKEWEEHYSGERLPIHKQEQEHDTASSSTYPTSDDQGRNEEHGQEKASEGNDAYVDSVRIYGGPYGGEVSPT